MTTNTGQFWTDFDQWLAKPLEWVRVELEDRLAAWDEIPDVSAEFVEHMDEAHRCICRAIEEMKRAREGGQS
jgi:hypothetical protein